MPTATDLTLCGTVNLRPWRVGLLIDPTDEHQVRDAIGKLTRTWGGYHLPILDARASSEAITAAARRYDLDSLFADDPTSDLEALLRNPGYSWRGRGPWAPFADNEEGLEKGLLRIEQLTGPRPGPATAPTSVPLLLAGYTGLLDGAAHLPASPDTLTAIETTTERLSTFIHYGSAPPEGLLVTPDTPLDVVSFWNARSLGGRLFPLAADDSELNDQLLARILPLPPTPPTADVAVQVWALDRLSARCRSQLQERATAIGVTLTDAGTDLPAVPFGGYDAVTAHPFRIHTGPATRTVTLPLERLPTVSRTKYFTGIIAAEIDITSDSGLDPRLTTAIPPHRRHAALLEPSLISGTDHVRVSSRGAVLAVQAGTREVTLPIPHNLDVMRLLFDDPAVQVQQSEVGRFETRVAEMLGGSTSGTLTQPALRAMIEQLATHPNGLTLHELHGIAARTRGAWPDPLYSRRLTAKDYDDQLIKHLLNSGLLVPMLDAQCSFCRVTSHIEANALSAELRCEFCNHDFSLALSLALTKPTWRYRLAGHIPADRVQAMLPVAAAMSVLAQLQHSEGPRMAHVLGLELALPGQRMEVDIATVLQHDAWTVVLGEVKSHNRIDEHDAQHLGELQRRLRNKDVVSVLLFATFKDDFSAPERAAIRAVAEQNARLVPSRSPGHDTALTPLLWTAHDLSLPWGHDEHPWRWAQEGDGFGLLGIAQASCRRHLGLDSWQQDTTGALQLTWNMATP